MKQKLATLELGRFIAASLVVLSHIAPSTNNYAATPSAKIFTHFDAGPLGVAYFFVLSGFVMATTHAADFGRLSSVPKFLWRRACRIYPVFWLAMAIPIYSQFAALTPQSTAQLLSLIPTTTQELLPPAWTLRYEAAFYLMLSLCLLPYIGRPLLITWIATTIWTWSGCGILKYILPPPPAILIRIANSPLNHFNNFDEFYFFAGLIAGLSFAKSRLSPRATLPLLAAGTIGFVACLSQTQWGSAYGSPDIIALMGLSIAAIMLALATLEAQNRLKISPIAGKLGAISYPLYILHWSIFILAYYTIPHLSLQTPALIALFLAFTIAIFATATTVTFLFDQPIQRRLRQLFRASNPLHKPAIS